MNETVGLVGLAVILAKTLEKLIDFVINKVKGDRKSNVSDPLKNMQQDIAEIKSILARADINGAPLIYFPRTIEARQVEAINLLNDQAHSQENNVKILDKMADKIIEVGTRTEQILHEVRK
jgi:hypothetical protein